MHPIDRWICFGYPGADGYPRYIQWIFSGKALEDAGYTPHIVRIHCIFTRIRRGRLAARAAPAEHAAARCAPRTQHVESSWITSNNHYVPSDLSRLSVRNGGGEEIPVPITLVLVGRGARRRHPGRRIPCWRGIPSSWTGRGGAW